VSISDQITEDTMAFAAFKPCGCPTWIYMDLPSLGSMIGALLIESFRDGENIQYMPMKEARGIRFGHMCEACLKAATEQEAQCQSSKQ
jgi:hypothetical protein